jgi:hypothetical protein
MGWGILKIFIGYLDKAAEKLPECREASNGLKYTLSDAIKSALALLVRMTAARRLMAGQSGLVRGKKMRGGEFL